MNPNASTKAVRALNFCIISLHHNELCHYCPMKWLALSHILLFSLAIGFRVDQLALQVLASLTWALSSPAGWYLWFYRTALWNQFEVGLMVHTYNPVLWKQKKEEVQGYIMSWRPIWATQDSTSKKKVFVQCSFLSTYNHRKHSRYY